MNPFDRLDRIASRAVDRLNAQRFILTPMTAPVNGRERRDPDRPIIEGKGVFEYMTVENGLQLGVRKSYREANDLQTLQVGREPVISIDRTRYFPQRDLMPRQGDIVKIIDLEGEPDFRVTSSQPDGKSRVVLKLNNRGKV